YIVDGLRISKKFINIFLTVFFLIMPVMLLSVPVYSADTMYDFSDEAQEEFDRQEAEPQQTEIKSEPRVKRAKKNPSKYDKETIKPQELILDDKSGTKNTKLNADILYIKEGTEIQAMLQSSISSGSLAQNDTISAVLIDDWIYNGKLIAPRDSILYGNAVEGKSAGYLYSNGQMAITFNQLLLPSGDLIPLTTNVVTLKAQGNRAIKVIKNVAGGAIAGLISGVLYTLITGGDIASGIAVGASVGGGGGLVTAAMQKGEDAEIPAGTVINVILTKPMKVVPYQQ
ncbi:MAG: hypothetical protein LUB59_04505, partial [Candidatus Gastranaerophilales bacterium]|nr:hypothetical protein [Candidatus Gastranaerophilales bacterium]